LPASLLRDLQGTRDSELPVEDSLDQVGLAGFQEFNRQADCIGTDAGANQTLDD
jgi:hypothetical protein